LIGLFHVQGKQRIVLLVLLLFGLPAIVTTSLLVSNVKRDVHDGAQPGGGVRGTVRDEQAHAVDGIAVTAFALAPAAGTRTLLGVTHTDTNGAFQMTLPPVSGHYELRFTGAEWQELRVDHGWLDQAGKPVDPGPLEIQMHAGCSLVVDIVGSEDRPAGPGTFELEGAPSTGIFGGWMSLHETRHGSFENGSFSIEGLPPMHGRLLIRMSTGERIDSTLDLVRGKNHHKVEL
jgi:hypothetical protein